VVHDNTDVNGEFRVVVAGGTYILRLFPVLESGLLPLNTAEIVVSADLDLGTFVLQAGVFVEGFVFDDVGAPAPNIDIDLIDEVSGIDQLLAGDLTDATGFFRSVVAPGSYVVQYEPPPSTGLLPLSLSGVSIPADTVLPDVFLQAGFIVEGFVVDSFAQPVPGVDIDFVDSPTGVDQPLVGDLTDDAGFFRTVVAGGTYRVQYEPPIPFLPAEIDGVSIPADTVLPDVCLQAGFIVEGFVVDAGGTPVGDVDTDWFVDGTCDQVFTIDDSTDATGHFELALAPGIYKVFFIPGAGNGLFPESLEAQNVGPGDTVLPTQQLPAQPLLSDACDGLDNDCDGAIDEGCGIQLQLQGTLMTWSGVADATGYDVLAGNLGQLTQTGDFASSTTACLADDLAVTELPDPDPIAPGEAFWYLVRSVYPESVGSYGSPPRDAGIDNSPSACP